MERTELMLGEGVNRLRACRTSRHPPDGEIRRMPDDRMLLMRNTLKLFAPSPTMNSNHSNASDLRLQSRHVLGLPKENKTTMTTGDGASDPLHSNEVCDPPQGGTLRTPPARRPACAKFKTDIHLNFNDAA
jgi:hypothetical protein